MESTISVNGGEPQEFWSPMEQMFEILNRLTKLGKDGAVKKMFSDMWDYDDESLEQLLNVGTEKPEIAENIGIEFYYVMLTSVHCVRTMRALEKNDLNLAWQLVGDAAFWCGMASACNMLEDIVRENASSVLKKNAKNAASHRHAENRKLKEDALRWYQEHREQYRSKDKAAEEIAGKVVPVAFRTVRDWLSKEK